MEIAVCIRRAVIVDDDVDTLNIDTTTEDISRHEDTLLEGLEGRVAVDTEESLVARSKWRACAYEPTAPLVRAQSGC